MASPDFVCEFPQDFLSATENVQYLCGYYTDFASRPHLERQTQTLPATRLNSGGQAVMH